MNRCRRIFLQIEIEKPTNKLYGKHWFIWKFSQYFSQTAKDQSMDNLTLMILILQNVGNNLTTNTNAFIKHKYHDKHIYNDERKYIYIWN